MTLQNLYSLDNLAFLWFLLCWAGYAFATSRGTLAQTGLVARMNMLRRQWMREMAVRDNRMMDAQLINAVARGNAFFASTSILVIAGLVATLGAVGNVRDMLNAIPYLHDVSLLELELKVGAMIAIYIFAFFKFAWAYRLSLNTAIMIGATPQKTSRNAKLCLQYAERCADMAVLVARHGTAGLRAFYFGMAVLSWFIHPLFFMAVAVWVVLVLYRREYKSKALAALADI